MISALFANCSGAQVLWGVYRKDEPSGVSDIFQFGVFRSREISNKLGTRGGWWRLCDIVHITATEHSTEVETVGP